MADFSELTRFGARLGAVSVAVEQAASLAVRKAAHDIEATAKQLAPVDTGALRSSIYTATERLAADIGPTVHYAPYLEYGTVRAAAQPFMGPAAAQHGPEFVRALGLLGGRI